MLKDGNNKILDLRFANTMLTKATRITLIIDKFATYLLRSRLKFYCL